MSGVSTPWQQIAVNVTSRDRIHQVSQGKLPQDEFDRVLDKLLYRLGAIRQAKDYTWQLELGFVPAEKFTDQGWLRDHPDLRKMGRLAWREIVSRGAMVFPRPPPNVYRPYCKPHEYLAAAFATAGTSELSIKIALRGLVESMSSGINHKET